MLTYLKYHANGKLSNKQTCSFQSLTLSQFYKKTHKGCAIFFYTCVYFPLQTDLTLTPVKEFANWFARPFNLNQKHKFQEKHLNFEDVNTIKDATNETNPFPW